MTDDIDNAIAAGLEAFPRPQPGTIEAYVVGALGIRDAAKARMVAALVYERDIPRRNGNPRRIAVADSHAPWCHQDAGHAGACDIRNAARWATGSDPAMVERAEAKWDAWEAAHRPR